MMEVIDADELRQAWKKLFETSAQALSVHYNKRIVVKKESSEFGNSWNICRGLFRPSLVAGDIYDNGPAGEGAISQNVNGDIIPFELIVDRAVLNVVRPAIEMFEAATGAVVQVELVG